MKIYYENSLKKYYCEITPSITLGVKPFRLYIGWLFWNITIVNE